MRSIKGFVCIWLIVTLWISSPLPAQAPDAKLPPPIIEREHVLPMGPVVSRGDSLISRVREATVSVTAYTAGYESTGKRPGQKGYGMTASGTKAKQGRTIAMNNLPFGTRVCIEGKWYVVEDRIGHGTDIDIFVNSLKDARKFGRKTLTVLIED